MSGLFEGANNLTLDELLALDTDVNGSGITTDENNGGENGSGAQNVSTEGNANTATETETQAFSRRLNESRVKIRSEEQERIAKELGYESYSELQKEKERKLLDDKGYDAEELKPILDQMVEERLKNDPRLKATEEQEMQRFAKESLAEVTKATGGKVTTFAQIDEDVLKLWQGGMNLKEAYYAKHGDEIIAMRAGSNNAGSTAHLGSTDGANGSNKAMRPLTPEEKRAWKVFFPNMTEEEINKKVVEK